MIKMVVGAQRKDTNEPVKILMLGLSWTNLDLLREGRPIHISETEMNDLSIDGVEVLVFSDETEEKMQTELEKRFTVTNRMTRQ